MGVGCGRDTLFPHRNKIHHGERPWHLHNACVVCHSQCTKQVCLMATLFCEQVQRKHHCRYCGQIFIADVCKKMAKIPVIGFKDPVRVCDTCLEQIERGDPVCLTKQVALIRSDSEALQLQGLKTLANWASMDPQFALASVASAVETLKVPESLAQLLQTGTASTQAAASQLLAQMFSHTRYEWTLLNRELPTPPLHLKSLSCPYLAAPPATPAPPRNDAALTHILCPCPMLVRSHRDLLQQKSLLEPLLGALRKGGPETKTSAMRAIAALTATDSGRAQLRAANGLPHLLNVLLADSVDELQEATCQVLANLCEDQTDDWQQLLQNGAIFSLLAMLSTSNSALQQVVLELLAMLCFHGECRDQVADGGCMPDLAALLGSSKPDIQRAALALSQQLTVSRRACEAMLEAGAASPLAAMLLTSNAGSKEVRSPKPKDAALSQVSWPLTDHVIACQS